MCVSVAEKTGDVGGLTASHSINGNYYEFGVHHLHASDPLIFDEIRRLMGDRLHAVEKSAQIRYGNGLRRYPIEFGDILKAMPPLTLAQCCLGLIAQQARNRLRPQPAADGEHALIQLYGRPLYRVFFRDFTHRYWGIPPRELSPVFIQKKMPRLSAFDVIQKLLSALGIADKRKLGLESALAKEILYYTDTGAYAIYQTLLGHIRQRGATVRLKAPVCRIEWDDAGVAAVTLGDHQGTVLEDIRFCISTIPLPTLIQAFGERAPAVVREAAQALHYKPQSVVGLLVKRERVLGSLYVYFRDRVFHRVGEPKLSGLRVQPPDHTILVVELTEEVKPGDREAQTRVIQEVYRDLQTDGFIAGPEDVVEHHFFHQRYAYPIFRTGFERHLETIAGFLRKFPRLLSTGRQGAFSYPNMHEAMRLGHEAARAAIASLAGATYPS